MCQCCITPGTEQQVPATGVSRMGALTSQTFGNCSLLGDHVPGSLLTVAILAIANQARVMYNQKVKVVAACPYFMTALDTERGGDFTLYITGNKASVSLRRPVVCSKRSKKDFPLPNSVKQYNYCARLKGETCFGDRFVMAQHFYGDYCALFCAALPASDIGKRSAKWCTRSLSGCFPKWGGGPQCPKHVIILTIGL